MASARGEHIEILRNAVEMEFDGERFFSEMAQWARYPSTKDMFAALARQEQRHIEVLNEQLLRLQSGGDWTSPASVRSGKNPIPNASVFSEEGRQGIVFDPNAGELEAIKLGMEVERRSMEYYRRAGAEVKSTKARAVFNWLVGEEAGHLTILTAEYDHRSRSGFYFDTPEFSLEVM